MLAVELTRLELELLSPFVTSSGELLRRPLILVRVITDGAEGVGECSALAEPTYTAEYADAAEEVLANHLLPRLMASRRLASVEEAMGRLADVRGHAMAKAAVEMALLDAQGRTEGRSLASRLGAEHRLVPAGATVGLAEHPGAMLAAVRQAVEAGYGRVKCKIAPGRDLAPLAAVRTEYPALMLLADANGSYRLDSDDDLRALLALDGLGLVALEQPLAAGDLTGHATLRRRIETPLLLDESVSDLYALDAAVALEACDAVSVKPARLGGVLAAVDAVRRCERAGLSVAIGGMLESGVGRAASLAVAALGGQNFQCELGASDRYFSEDLTEPYLLHGGCLLVPDGPGLGVRLREEVLTAATVRVRSWRSSAGSTAS